MDKMEFYTLDDINVKGKRVLVRVDVNSPMNKEQKIIDTSRFESVLPTIKELVSNGAGVIILAHQGRKGDSDFTSMKQHADVFSKLLDINVKFIDDICGDKALKAITELKEGEIIMLDNVRMHSSETEKMTPQGYANTDLIKNLARATDIYVNDAFAASHRAQCSLIGFTEVMPSVAGRLMEKELSTLSKIFSSPSQPAYFILGGAKFQDAIKVIERILSKNLGTVLLTGLTANAFLMAEGIDVGEKNKQFLLKDSQSEHFEMAEDILDKYRAIILPEDVAIEVDGRRVEISISNLPTQYPIFDIGASTIKKFKKIIENARTIFFSGPAGVFEKETSDKGTGELFTAIANTNAFTICGGGHTIAALEKFGIKNKISYISTGGGALEEFIRGEKLPVIEALKRARDRKSLHSG